MTAPRAGQIDQLVGRWSSARARLVAAALATLTPQWRTVDPYDTGAVDTFAAAAARTSQAAQDRSGQLMEAFLRSVLTLLQTPTPTGVLVPTGVPARIGVDPVAVYQRPAATVRYQRSRDATGDDAAELGARRLAQLVDTDVALSARNASQRVLTSVERVTGFRRVLRPEMSAGGSCGLCLVASDRLYSRGDLLDLHNGCRCVTLPITRTQDPGLALNGEDLAAIYAAAGTTSDRQKLQRTRIKVVEHGELGPVLTNAEHAFRGPDDLAA